MKLSIIIPVFNEAETIREVLNKIISVPQEKEIIVVDDCSIDGTRDILKALAMPDIRLIFHERNMGKGAAIRTGLKEAKGDAVIVQDADLEYDPTEFVALMDPIKQGRTAVVYGSRFKGGGKFLLRSRLANRFLTVLTNFLFGCHLSDMETCYKCMRIDVARSMQIKSNGFEVEPEITAKILKRGFHIWEVPITYRGRRSSEGKKIGWKDGLKAIVALIRYRFRE